MIERIGYWLGCWLSCPRPWHYRGDTRVEGNVMACLEPGDVLLVEGSSRQSTVIKYLTQSCWSHAALFVGREAAERAGGATAACFIEADLVEGVRLVGFDEYDGLPLRICRPVGLEAADIDALIDFACRRVGHRYDLRNIIDLIRYLLPLPPVPSRWRQGMLMLGSGDPTRAICSTLIAQAFQSIRYPILPIRETRRREAAHRRRRGRRVLRPRHYSLFTPRDFDLSPYFHIVKPKLIEGFDPHSLTWVADEPEMPARA